MRDGLFIYPANANAIQILTPQIRNKLLGRVFAAKKEQNSEKTEQNLYRIRGKYEPDLTSQCHGRLLRGESYTI